MGPQLAAPLQGGQGEEGAKCLDTPAGPWESLKPQKPCAPTCLSLLQLACPCQSPRSIHLLWVPAAQVHPSRNCPDHPTPGGCIFPQVDGQNPRIGTVSTAHSWRAGRTPSCSPAPAGLTTGSTGLHWKWSVGSHCGVVGRGF